MALVSARPPKTTFSSKKVFTLTTGPNNMLLVSPPNKKTAVLAFKNQSCAIEFGRLMEAHKAQTKEWPTLQSGKFRMYDDGRKEPMFVATTEWEIDELQYTCAVRFMNIILVDCFSNNSQLKGEYMSLNVPTEFHQDYLDYIWSLHDQQTDS